MVNLSNKWSKTWQIARIINIASAADSELIITNSCKIINKLLFSDSPKKAEHVPVSRFEFTDELSLRSVNNLPSSEEC